MLQGKPQVIADQTVGWRAAFCSDGNEKHQISLSSCERMMPYFYNQGRASGNSSALKNFMGGGLIPAPVKAFNSASFVPAPTMAILDIRSPCENMKSRLFQS